MSVGLGCDVGGTIKTLRVASEAHGDYVEVEVPLVKVDFGDPKRPHLFLSKWTCPFCSTDVETGCADSAGDGGHECDCPGCGSFVVGCRCPSCGRGTSNGETCDVCRSGVPPPPEGKAWGPSRLRAESVGRA